MKSGGSSQKGVRCEFGGFAARAGVVFAALVVIVGSATGLGAQDLPNFVFILSDDHGIDAIQGADWPNDLDCHTPNLAGFAAQGRAFSVTRVNSKCSPTRASFLTGRSALRTGVTDRLQGGGGADMVRLSLQGKEHTIPELLKQMGYYTVLVDKWHLGTFRELRQAPDQQSFDVYLPTSDYMHLDDPEVLGDEHISRMVSLAVNTVNHRPDPTAPYALFFWTSEPHSRSADSTGMNWWKVHRSLLPSGTNYYGPERDSNVNRFRAVVEALDTEVWRLLRQLGVIRLNGLYREDAETVVFFMGDNGTDPRVAPRANWAKGSVFEGGVRVPMFVFGHNVPNDGQIMDDLIDVTDFYDTVGDIIGAGPGPRGDFPRDGMSFADLIGWSDEPLPRREFTMSALMDDPSSHRLLIALADQRYKLIVRGGHRGTAPLEGDHFYDLLTDPDEVINLTETGLTPEQRRAYLNMRHQITNYWATSVGGDSILQVDVPMTHSLCYGSDEVRHVETAPVGHVDPENPEEHVETRLFVRFDIASINQLLPQGYSFGDIERAEIIIGFDEDTESPDNDDTGPLLAYPMRVDWLRRLPDWERLSTGHYDALQVGMADLPPFVVVEPEADMHGIPMPPGTPVSFGQSGGLMTALQYWRANPNKNFGVVVMATPLTNVGLDQHVDFMHLAALRLTLRLD